jgi:hypothetical protein
MYLDDVSTIVLPFTEEDTPPKKKICAVTQPNSDGCKRFFLIFVIEGWTQGDCYNASNLKVPPNRN